MVHVIMTTPIVKERYSPLVGIINMKHYINIEHVFALNHYQIFLKVVEESKHV